MAWVIRRIQGFGTRVPRRPQGHASGRRRSVNVPGVYERQVPSVRQSLDLCDVPSILSDQELTSLRSDLASLARQHNEPDLSSAP